MRIETRVTSRSMAILLVLGLLGGAPMAQAQNTGPVDRGAAGSGSMGIGEGIDPEPQRTPREEARDDGDHSADNPGHGGGNETDMQHHNQYQAQPEKRD
ncbi:hypothetical protein [Stutzerimonas nosocomialis]|nr:hypothetical protein [Stutzerimonas nosocomialis]